MEIDEVSNVCYAVSPLPFVEYYSQRRCNSRQCAYSCVHSPALISPGWDKNDPRLLAGADYLLQSQLPGDTSPQVRDTYYWYYATQVLKFVDGQRWNQWNNLLRPMLIRSQEKSGDLAGSWNPYRPVPDRWGGFGGRLYVTTMNLLSLEVRHRMLPLYQTNK